MNDRIIMLNCQMFNKSAFENKLKICKTHWYNNSIKANVEIARKKNMKAME